MYPNHHAVNLGSIFPTSQSIVEPIKFRPTRNKSQSCEDINGIKWYYYLVPNDKNISLTDVIGQNGLLQKFVTCLIIPRETGRDIRIFAAFDSYLEFLHYIKRIPKDRWCFFEVIIGEQIQKLYFDIDIPVKDLPVCENVDSFCNRLLTNLIVRILDTFREHGYTLDIKQNILLFSSNNERKRSYHIIVDKYAVMNSKENSILVHEILDGFPEEYRKFIDDSMYSSKQQLRLWQSQKPGSGRPKIFVDEWWFGPTLVKYSYPEISAPDKDAKEGIRFTTLFAASCVTITDNCQIIPIIFEESQTPNGRPFDIDDNEDMINSDIVKAICDRADPQVFRIFSIYKVMGTLILLKRKGPARCTMCDRVHENENAYFRVSKTGKVYFHCRRKDDYNLGRNLPLQSRFVTDVSDLIPGMNVSENHVQSLMKRLNQTSQNYINQQTSPSVWGLHGRMRELASQPHEIFKCRNSYST